MDKNEGNKASAPLFCNYCKKAGFMVFPLTSGSPKEEN